MKAFNWLTIFGILLIHSNLSTADNSDDDGDVPTNCTCGVVNKEDQFGVFRIVGGVGVKKNEWPMIAELSYEGKHYCAGTLVTARHVITAAQCGFYVNTLTPLPYERVDVNLGVHAVTGDRAFEGAQVFSIKQFIVHPKYQPSTRDYDIAMILLNGKVDFKLGKAIPVCLPVGNEWIDGDGVTALGWGATNFNSESTTKTLMKVNLKIIDNYECKINYKNFNKETQLCIYGKGKDTCEGDTGGPQLWKDLLTQKYVLMGVISYRRNCGKLPSVNIKVMNFLQWIESVISATDATQKSCSRVRDF